MPIERLDVAGGIENNGRVRLGVGPRLSYTMVERATRDASFARALFGDIGGFGIGGQGWLAVDVVRAKRFTVGTSLRGVADLYDGGTSVRVGAALEVAF